jgi:hypothetical protein
VTTGSVVNNYIKSVPATPELGNRVSGSIAQKTWSGTDWPDAFVKIVDLQLPDKESYRYIWDPISRKKVRVLWNKSTNNHKITYQKPPKRSYTEEHSYSVSGYTSQAHSGLRYKTDDGTNRIVNSSVFLTGSRPFDSIVDPWDSYDQLALIGKLREKISGSSFNAGIFLGEGKQSLHTITSSATRIYHAYRAARGHNIKHAFDILTDPSFFAFRRKGGRRSRYNQNIGSSASSPYLGDNQGSFSRGNTWDSRASSMWLELQYAWKPLLQDVEEGAKFLAHQFSAPLQSKVSVTRNHGGANSKKLKEFTQHYPDSRSHFFLAKGTPVQSSRRLIATLKERSVVPLSGLMSVESIAWELMPWSFVADWFIPVGSYLDARALNQQLVATYVTCTRCQVDYCGPITNNGGSKEIDPTHCELEGRAKLYTFSRSAPDSSLTIPTPEMKPLGKIATWVHAQNAVALLVNTFRSGSHFVK